MIKYVVSTFLLVGAAVLYLMFKVGAFHSVSSTVTDVGPFFLLSAAHLGPYHKIVPVLEKVETWAKEQNLNCDLSFGEYMDDPESMAEDRLRSQGGCWFDARPKLPTAMPEGFVLSERPSRKYLVLTFSGAPSLAPLKVYPRAAEELEKRRLTRDGAVIERYQSTATDSGLTTYLFPIKDL